MTLYDIVTGWMQNQQMKHDLGSTYVERTVNEMSQHEFLEVLSRALEGAGLLVPDDHA